MDVALIPVPMSAGERFTMRAGRCLIGRGYDCDLQIDNCLVSRHHAELVNDDESLQLRDLASLNGTFVNGNVMIGNCFLHDGDVVAFGVASYEVRIHRTFRERIRVSLGTSED